jgi:hypothetical protein
MLFNFNSGGNNAPKFYFDFICLLIKCRYTNLFYEFCITRSSTS